MKSPKFFSSIYGSWDGTQRAKLEALKKILHLFAGKKILDIGSPDDRFAKFLKDNDIFAEVITLDIEGRPDVLGDGNSLPFASESFDAVVSIDAMQFIYSDDFHRVLKQKGIVLFGIFFNMENYNEKRGLLLDKLNNFKIMDEFEFHGKENEYFVLASKK
jgi:cyclopropane fatty-acyl-phospholipid synthase-like methyltransferase